MIGPAVTDARRMEVEKELREVEDRITEAIQSQEEKQSGIDVYEQLHHKQSKEQDEGKLSALLVPVMWTHVHKLYYYISTQGCGHQIWSGQVGQPWLYAYVSHVLRGQEVYPKKILGF